MFRGTYTSIQSHFYMINDDHRTNSFIKAIQQKVNKNSTVIDLGSGTGILGLECAKAGAKQVHLVEQESKLASIIQEAVQHKNLKQTCIVHNKRSDDFFKSFNESADLIVCEGIGDHIFESRMIYDFLLYKEKLNITHSIPESFKLCIHSHTVKINRQRLGEHQELIDKLDIPVLDSIYMVEDKISDPLYVYGDKVTDQTCILEFSSINDLNKEIKVELSRIPSKDEYLILYFDILLGKDIFLSNHPSRPDQNHSYYQRLISCKNITSAHIKINIDYTQHVIGVEDKPYPNIEVHDV